MGFKTELKKTRTGERYELETLKDFHFQPVLYSVAGEDELQAITMKNKDLIPASVIKRLQGKELKPEELLDELTEEEYEKFLSNLSANTAANLDLMRIKIRYGFGPNNFSDGFSTEGALTGPNPIDAVDALLENSEVAHEVVNIIDEFNSPLSRKQ